MILRSAQNTQGAQKWASRLQVAHDTCQSRSTCFILICQLMLRQDPEDLGSGRHQRPQHYSRALGPFHPPGRHRAVMERDCTGMHALPGCSASPSATKVQGWRLVVWKWAQSDTAASWHQCHGSASAYATRCRPPSLPAQAAEHTLHWQGELSGPQTRRCRAGRR